MAILRPARLRRRGKNRVLVQFDANGRFSRFFKPLDGVLWRPREDSRAFARSAVWPTLRTRSSGARRVVAAGLEDGESIGAILVEQQKGLVGFPRGLIFTVA